MARGDRNGDRGIESAKFLTEEQKRDIFYNNAVRFLRLDEKTLQPLSPRSTGKPNPLK
jgi:hypothetical protein